MIDKVSVSDDYNGQRVLDELIRLGETGRARGKAKALVLGSYGLSQRARPAMLKALRASGEAEALAEELVRVAADGKYTSRKVPISEALLELGDAKHAAEMAREVIANQALLGNHLARMARVLTLSEGLHAADGIVTLLTAKEDRLKDNHLLEVADCLASAGALAAWHPAVAGVADQLVGPDCQELRVVLFSRPVRAANARDHNSAQQAERRGSAGCEPGAARCALVLGGAARSPGERTRQRRFSPVRPSISLQDAPDRSTLPSVSAPSCRRRGACG